MLEIKKTDELPPVRRSGGRTSAEREQIKAALQTFEPVVIENVAVGKPYNALQQRIRQAAASIGVKVYIRQTKKDDNLSDLYFEGYTLDDDKPTKKSSPS